MPPCYSATITEDKQMSLGPSRRSRLALGRISPSNKYDDESYSSTSKPRRAGFHHPLSPKSPQRRIPFNIWMVSIATYCFFMLMHTRSYRALRDSTYNHPSSYSSLKSAAAKEIKATMKATNSNSVGVGVETATSIAASGKSDIPKSMVEENDSSIFSPDIVHVVETRFMQKQSKLLELGLARLSLFETFCLPSMLRQTDGNFLWIIRADPDIHMAISGTLTQLLDGKQNFILIGSNDNPEGFGRSGSPFKDFLGNAPVWSGNVTLLEQAYEQSAAGSVMLETRLDADDGLAHNYIKSVQKEAVQYLTGSDTSEHPGNKWRLWCIHSNFEWHPLNPYPETDEIKAAETNRGSLEGYLVLFSDKSVCATPGLTFGYGEGASRQTMGVNHLRHDQIVKTIKACKKKNSNDDIGVECVSRLTNLVPGAVRARTATSAGMHNVVTGNTDLDKNHALKARTKSKQLVQQYFEQDQLWKGLEELFSITRENAQYARTTIVQRSAEIAEDNLRGQCTAGHSCKNGTKIMLAKMSDA